MKMILVVLMLVSCVCVDNVLAASDPVKKIKRGVVNVVTSPLEIPKEVRAHWIKGSEKTYHILVWIACGFVKGTVMTAARIGSGAWDIVSAPVSVPEDNEPLLKPDYVFDQWPQREEGVVYKNLGEK